MNVFQTEIIVFIVLFTAMSVIASFFIYKNKNKKSKSVQRVREIQNNTKQYATHNIAAKLSNESISNPAHSHGENRMDLQNFVSETLIQIINGISIAQDKARNTTAKVSPRIDSTDVHKSHAGMMPVSSEFPVTIITFDVALTATEETGTKGGIRVVAGNVTLGSSGQSLSENSSISRVKFSVPVILPIDDKKEKIVSCLEL